MITPLRIMTDLYWGTHDALENGLDVAPWINKATIWSPLSWEGIHAQRNQALETLAGGIRTFKTDKSDYY